MTPSPAQLRAARAWLHWSREKAAFEAGLHVITVGRAERGEPSIATVSLQNLIAVYRTRGFVFGTNTVSLDGGPR